MNKQYDRADLTEADVCAHCGKDLRTVDEIHTIEGMLFCQEECAVDYQAEIIRNSAKETAREWYSDGAEIVTPKDIGIVD